MSKSKKSALNNSNIRDSGKLNNKENGVNISGDNSYSAEMKIVPDEHEQLVQYVHKDETQLSDDTFIELERSHEVGELAVDVFHNDEEIVVVAPIAGITAKDFSINVTKGVLTIRGRRGFAFNVSPDEYVTRECFWGAFSRNIILPDHVDVAKIKASFKNGVLVARVPKLKPLEVKVVEIEKD